MIIYAEIGAKTEFVIFRGIRYVGQITRYLCWIDI